jgi:arginine utilization protein RocB
MVERDGKMFGRGSTDDKGPVLAWINIIEAFQKTGHELPVNVKFCFEGMEESGSIGLDEALAKRKDTFLKVKVQTVKRKVHETAGCRLYVHIGQLLAGQEQAVHYVRTAVS